jgi:endonuclease/exonuclease/phosphatase family metal-dependent hydrolase
MATAACALSYVGSVLAQPTCDQVLFIGAWNVQWLGNAKAGKRKPQKPEDIASYIAAAKVDVLALEEISVTSKDGQGRARNQTLEDAFAVANASGPKWQYELFSKRDGARAPEDQWTGIAWNAAKVTKVGGPWRLDATIDPAREESINQRFDSPESETIIFSRWPHAVKFSAGSGKTDFLVVPVHLKSNIGGEATADARAYEATLLFDALTKLKPAQQDGDVIVLGDTNMLRATEPAAALFQKAGLKDCNQRDIGTHLTFKRGERSAPFDRVYVMTGQPETASSCLPSGKGEGALDFKVVRPADWQSGTTNSQFRERLSDHLLVRAGMCVTADDD